MDSTAGPMVAQANDQHLRVSWIANSCLEEPYSSHGSLAISACPGAKTRSTQRDIKQDLGYLRDTCGISRLVCLLNDAELRVRVLCAVWVCDHPQRDRLGRHAYRRWEYETIKIWFPVRVYHIVGCQ